MHRIIKKWREGLHLSQLEAAPYFGVSQTTYHNWEAEKAKPQIKHLFIISQVCQVELGTIIPKDMTVALNADSLSGDELQMNALELYLKIQDGKDQTIARQKTEIETQKAENEILKVENEALKLKLEQFKQSNGHQPHW